MAKIPYKQAIGSIMYVMIATRLDIVVMTGIVSQCMKDPKLLHWKVVDIEVFVGH